jgi:RNA polymerase sigma factor (TIGR02999 family)
VEFPDSADNCSVALDAVATAVCRLLTSRRLPGAQAKVSTTDLPIVRAALDAARDGGEGALDALVEALYAELRVVARGQLRRLRPGQTLDTTALVHEAYVKLVGASDFVDRSHFLAASARAMRHILVNAARRKLADKHGGGQPAITLDGCDVADQQAHYTEVVAVGQALERLREIDERLCRLVECRFYAGMTEEETAVALDISDRTVRRDWLRARAWLKHELGLPPVSSRQKA